MAANATQALRRGMLLELLQQSSRAPWRSGPAFSRFAGIIRENRISSHACISSPSSAPASFHTSAIFLAARRPIPAPSTRARMRQSREQPGPVTYGRPPPPPPRSVLKERADKFGEEDEEEEQATGEAGANGSAKPKSRLSRLRFRNWPHSLQIIWCTIAYTLGISAITVFFFEHVGSLLWITGRSMAPSLNEDFGIKDMWRDCVVVKRWNPALDLKRGMIVVFPSPHDPSNIAVKRVIGLPGDCVTTRYPCPKEKRFLDWNHVWVEGDIEDPKETRDSNTYGPISLGLITGQAIAVLYPRPRRLKWQDWEEAEEGTIAASQRNRVQRSAIEVLNPDII